MPITVEMTVRVAKADVLLDMAFSRTIALWQPLEIGNSPLQVRSGNCSGLLIGRNDAVAIDGDCSNPVSAPEGGIIHVYGDLLSNIDAGGHHEIIITGNVAPHARIIANGFCHVFVGGEFAGNLESTDSTLLWVESDFNGIMKTGCPSTRLHVMGDFNGQIVPRETPALLTLSVAGFASHDSLSRIVDMGYTQFNASVAQSDVEPGIYPPDGHRRNAKGHNSFNRWCVVANDRRQDGRQEFQSDC